MLLRIAKLLGLPSPAVLIAILVAIAIPAVIAGVQTLRHSAAASKLDELKAEKKVAERRAEAAEQTLKQYRQRQAQADTAATSDSERLGALETRTAKQKGEIDDLQSKHGTQRVSDLTRAHLERVRSRQVRR
jgi:uncharacterized protein HemX